MTVAAADEGQSLVRAAEAQLAEGAFEAAVDTFTACLQEESRAAAAYRGRAIARFQLKQWGLAVDDFRCSHQLDPADLESWVGWGMSLAMTHAIHEAIDRLEALAAAHPTYIRGRVQLAQLYYRLCVTAKGRHHMEKALASRPTAVERRLIEKTFEEQKKLDEKRYYRPDFEALRRQ